MLKEIPVLRLLTIFLGLLVLAGCSTSSSVVVGQVRPPISPEEVKVYNNPPAGYEEVAIVEANSKKSLQFSEQGKLDAAIGRLKEQAAKVGANGILINTISDEVGGGISFGLGTGSYSHSGGSSVGVGTSSASTYKIVTALAIFVTDDSMPVEEEPVEEE